MSNCFKFENDFISDKFKETFSWKWKSLLLYIGAVHSEHHIPKNAKGNTLYKTRTPYSLFKNTDIKDIQKTGTEPHLCGTKLC